MSDDIGRPEGPIERWSCKLFSFNFLRRSRYTHYYIWIVDPIKLPTFMFYHLNKNWSKLYVIFILLSLSVKRKWMELILHSVHHIMINLIVTDYVASRGTIWKKNRVRKNALPYKKTYLISGICILGKSGICIRFDISGILTKKGAASDVGVQTDKNKNKTNAAAANSEELTTTVFAIFIRFLKCRIIRISFFISFHLLHYLITGRCT